MAFSIGAAYRGIAWFSDYMGKKKIADCPSSEQKGEEFNRHGEEAGINQY
ncbi:hypothetical protein J41TS12_32380 [Paenibacillus antibioticophila]|uniref:Uncharacterized protein n=2 Tax=Paenibacillus TaxID=44249 RepID=A0A919XXE4_9BACL|nr:hypothetical protein J41TS12_32380 [Paenibacillus antibioticophila]